MTATSLQEISEQTEMLASTRDEPAAIARVALKCRSACRWVSTPARVATRFVNFEKTSGRIGSLPAGDRLNTNASVSTVSPSWSASVSTAAR